ncbi:MAG TPA: hypothetical protein VNF05_06045 [Acidimicrobiales bacterium]|nr:hypothetical protein [Acidimicrobiales bacterium]
MTLKEKYQALLTKDLGTPTETDPIIYIGNFFGAVSACIIGLAAEIDILRDELVAKGLLEGEEVL